jgi:hypothetical protein
MKDLKGAQVIVNFFGEEEILEVSKKFRGKFLKLFQKGWDILTNRDSFKEYFP